MRPDSPLVPPERTVAPNTTNEGASASIAPPSSAIPQVSPTQQVAATNIVRSQIDALYAQQPTSDQTATAQEQEAPNPYGRTHQPHAQPTADQWKQYHSAWQDYYQKYYERYYIGHVHQARQAILTQQSPAQPTTPIGSADSPSESISQNDAMHELREKLRDTVTEKARTVRKSRHFVPIAAGIGVMVIFAFLQYNQLLVANVKAYVSPGSIDPANIIVDPSLSTSVDPELSNLVIPKINIDAPVNYDAKPDNDSQMAAMNHGLAYFGIKGANSKPGQVGNTPIAGHSSNDVFAAGDYKFIFAQLEKLKKGDVIYANYQGTRYTYVVTHTEVVRPTEINKLVYDTDNPLMTLITCTPLGTAEKRLLVTAEQVSPDPGTAATAQVSSDTGEDAASSMAGTSPTLLQRLFGAR